MEHISFYSGSGPLVFDSPHSGTWYPPDFGYACTLGDLRQAEDTHVDKLWSFAAPLGQSFLQANFARSYLDVNRDRSEIDPAMIDGPGFGPPQPSDKVRLGMGLVWRETLSGTPIYRRKLSAVEVAQRITRCWDPYHGTLARAIGEARERHGYCIHVNCHSMPSRAALYDSFPGWVPTDFVLGDRQGTAAAPELTRWIADFLRGRGWSVDINRPFQGAELLRRHACPAEHRHSIQIEISRQLYMDEQTFALRSGAAAVQETLRELTEALLEQPDPT
jgi:N-formylglutamate deformylase